MSVLLFERVLEEVIGSSDIMNRLRGPGLGGCEATGNEEQPDEGFEEPHLQLYTIYLGVGSSKAAEDL
jgi:hypothetical protein